MVDIIRLHGDPHKQTQTLLPWYANGTLDADEVAVVEAHLSECAECRDELKSEQALGQTEPLASRFYGFWYRRSSF